MTASRRAGHLFLRGAVLGLCVTANVAAAAEPTEATGTPRLRIGVGGHLALGNAWTNAGHWALVTPGAEVVLGVEVTPRVSLLARGTFGTTLLHTITTGSVVAELYPGRSLAVGAGVGVGGLFSLALAECSGELGPSLESTCRPWVGGIVPMHVGLLFGDEESPAGRSRLEFVVAPGLAPNSGDFALASHLGASARW